MTVRIGSNVIAPGVASDEEFLEGLAEDKTATVKQLREAFSRVDRLPLFAPMRSPYLLNDVSWLRSDTFSWHRGDIYTSAYDLLSTLYTDNSATTSSDTIGGITITYKRVSNGMKICASDQENNLINLYNSVGVAWYFLIDTTNKKFKLPRNKFDFTGFRTAVSDYVEESLPNITGSLYNANTIYQDIGLDDGAGTGAIKTVTDSYSRKACENIDGYDNNNLGWNFDASRSSSTYQDNAPVQERAVQSYLYFYVGRFTKTSIEQSAGLNTEALDDKADKDLGNLSASGQSRFQYPLVSGTNIKTINNISLLGNGNIDIQTSIDTVNKSLTNTSYTTSRILEISQDIKLELNDGTLTLKAGSKVYIPNGFEADGTTPKFDVVVIENDIHAGGLLDSFTDKWVFCYRNNGFHWELLNNCFSGSTLPTQTGENRLGYNTTVNKFQGSINGGAYIDDICSFPICIFSTNSGAITSIDQIFNGFGYIGSTVFALPGLKVQIPDGKNEDGTYKSFTYTVESVLTNLSNTQFNQEDNVLGNAVINPDGADSTGVVGRNSLRLVFNPDTGYMERSDGQLKRCCIISDMYWNTTGIKVFRPYSVEKLTTDNDVVHRHLDEEIFGRKTYVDNGRDNWLPNFKNLQAETNNFIPTATTHLGGYFCKARDDTYTGGFYNELYHSSSEDSTRTYLFARRTINNTEYSTWIGAMVKSDGTIKNYAHVPENSKDNSNAIATTSWVRNHCCTTAATTTSTASKDAPAYVVENYRNGTTWYRVWSDGWIEQGGGLMPSGTTSITFLKAFDSTNITLLLTRNSAYQGGISSGFHGSWTSVPTKTGFTCFCDANTTYSWYACGY